MPTLLDVTGFEAVFSANQANDVEFDALNIGTGAQHSWESTLPRGFSHWCYAFYTGGSSAVSYGERDWGSDQATVCLCFMFRLPSVPSALTYFCTVTDSAGNAIIDLGVTAAGLWCLYNYGNTTTYTSTGAPVKATTWYRIEVKLYGHGSAGTLDWKTGGILEPGISGLTGLNTRPGGLPRKYRLGITAALANQNWRHFDDVIVADDWVGPAVVKVISPAANDASAWAVVDSGRLAWQVLREPLWSNSDGDLIRSNTAGQEDRYLLDVLASSLAGVVLGFSPVLRLRREGANAVSVGVALVSGATPGTVANLDAGSTSYKTLRGALQATDPQTGAAWALGAANAVKLRLVHDGSTEYVRVNAALVYAALTSPYVALAEPLDGVARQPRGACFARPVPAVHGAGSVQLPRRGRPGHKVTV